ncbi:hypothetical protein ACFWJS_04230 [Streptomyces sp. NPDC127061]|uniref:hypothetical protein n=1 Tax=Streptomyces sp. NPDC127061 TaxID=3347122 RepID=UPI00365B7EE3
MEDLYISSVEFLVSALDVQKFTLRDIILSEPAPPWLGDVHDGREIDLEVGFSLIRTMLRNGMISCSLESEGTLQVRVETDFYLSVEICANAVNCLAHIERMGLHSVQVSCLEEEESLISRPADDGFWREVAEFSRSAISVPVVLERWAQGSHGYQWYLIEGGDFSRVAKSVRRHSLVVAYFDAKVQWVSRNELGNSIKSTLLEDDFVVIFSRPKGEEKVKFVTCGEGIPLPGEDELPPGEDFGYFVWPDEDESPTLRAVVPGEDGRIVARWPEIDASAS